MEMFLLFRRMTFHFRLVAKSLFCISLTVFGKNLPLKLTARKAPAVCKYIPYEVPSKQSQLDLILRDFVDVNTNVFARKLLTLGRRRAGDSNNIVFSPASVALTLSMAFSGSNGATKTQIKEQIAESFDDDLVIGFYALLAQKLNEQNELLLINRGFVHQSFFVERAFLNTIESCFDGTFQSVDFRSDFEEARAIINQLMQEETQNGVKNILPESSISDLTRFILVNALQLNADWAEPFLGNAQIEMHEFFPLNQPADPQMMEFMHSVANFCYHKENDVKVLGLTYAGNEMMTYFILPENYSLFEANLSADKLITLMDKAADNKVMVDALVPKFDMKYGFPVKQVLMEMGVIDVFHPNLANLTRIADAQPPFFIDAAFHKTSISVNEKGTGTPSEITSRITVSPNEFSSAEKFFPNRPFIFAVRHEATRTFLLLGAFLTAS